MKLPLVTLNADDLEPFLRFGEGLITAAGAPAHVAAGVTDLVKGAVDFAVKIGRVELVKIEATEAIDVWVK